MLFRILFLLVALARQAAGMALAPGSKVLVVGNGGVQCLAARLAAICGYETTLGVLGATSDVDEECIFDSKYPKGSLPLTLLPMVGDNVDVSTVERCILDAEGLIIAFDKERVLPEASMSVFMPKPGEDKTALKHVSVMSRYLNGKGMGFTASAAKMAANFDIWAGGKMVDEYRGMETRVKQRAAEMGADATIIRAGTMKGGGSADANTPAGGGGEPMFLNPYFYTQGQQDVVNWRLLYDTDVLGVELSAGDTLPGPGFTAALTATDRCGQGDSHRGAVAMALVQALGCDAAKNKDFSVAAKEAREFPQPDAWPGMFAAAK